MAYVIVRDGIIENVVEWDGDTAKWQPPEGTEAFPAPARVSPGWAWVDGAPVEPPPPPVVEPSSYGVSRLRLKLELAERGLLGNVEAAVQAGGTVPQLYWAEATTFESNHPLVAQIGAAIGLTGEQIKALFKAAAEREA